MIYEYNQIKTHKNALYVFGMLLTFTTQKTQIMHDCICNFLRAADILGKTNLEKIGFVLSAHRDNLRNNNTER